MFHAKIWRAMWVVVLAAAGVGAMPASAHADTEYLDQATFVNAIQPGYYLESFDSQPTGTMIPGPISFSSGGYSYSASAIGGFYNIHDPSNSSDVYLSTYNPNSAITLSFTSNNVTAVGGDIFGSDYAGNPQASNFILFLDDGTTLNYAGASANNFVGFTTSVPIASLTINPTTNGAFATINNLYVGAVVPEPASFATTALLGFGLLRRRRTKAAPVAGD